MVFDIGEEIEMLLELIILQDVTIVMKQLGITVLLHIYIHFIQIIQIIVLDMHEILFLNEGRVLFHDMNGPLIEHEQIPVKLIG
jgi:hypothetical protein